MKLGFWFDLVAAGLGVISACLWWRASKIQPESGYDADTRPAFVRIGRLNANAAIFTGITMFVTAVKAVLIAFDLMH